MQTDNRSSSTLSSMDIQFNPEGWGPSTGGRLPIFEGVPYAHFDKKDRQVRPADFLSTNTNTNNKFQRRFETDFTYRHDAAEENTFQLVDTTKTVSKFKPAGECRSRTRVTVVVLIERRM
jgi:hypothetical protein